MEQKVLFLDLDGTLLNDSKEITPANREALDTMLARGHRVVIASGRPLSSALQQARRLNLDSPGCYVIGYNGGTIYDCTQKKEIFQKTLSFDSLYAIFDEAARQNVYIHTYSRELVVVERHNNLSYTQRYCDLTHMQFQAVDDIRQYLTEPPVKALLIDFTNRIGMEHMRQWIQENLAGKVDSFFSSPYLLEVVPTGINKGNALTMLCQLLDIPLGSTVAAGDEENDLTMLKAAGIGVAMQNAAERVKAAADYVTERDNNHSGVAEIIQRFFLQREPQAES